MIHKTVQNWSWKMKKRQEKIIHTTYTQIVDVIENQALISWSIEQQLFKSNFEVKG